MTKEIYDPEGHAWYLLDLLDGINTLDEVSAAMRHKFPDLTPEDVSSAIAALGTAGFLDDGTVTRYDTDPRYSRYVGNVNYFSHFPAGASSRAAMQDILCDTRVTLLGLGGGGSTILQLLLGVGAKFIRAIDHDRVEITNLNRQLLFQEESVGKLKAHAANDFASRRNSAITYEFIAEQITNPRQVIDLIDDSDIVISSIDQPPGIIQRVINKACVAGDVPTVYGLSQTSRGRVFSVLPGESGCIDCLYLHYNDVDSGWASRFRTVTSGAVARTPNVAFAPNIMRICAEVVDEAVRIRTGYLPVRSAGVQLEMDFETGMTIALSDWAWARDPDRCPTCGHGDEEAFAHLIGSPNMNELVHVHGCGVWGS